MEGRIVSAIGPGLLVLVGLHESDGDSDADYMYTLAFFFQKNVIFIDEYLLNL